MQNENCKVQKSNFRERFPLLSQSLSSAINLHFSICTLHFEFTAPPVQLSGGER